MLRKKNVLEGNALERNALEGKITIFLERKSRNQLFFKFFITKVSCIVSKPNDDFHEASFEVYYFSVSQKLAILGFSPQIFFILTSVTSETS